MEKDSFNKYLDEHHEEFEQIKAAAHEVHAAVNQHYDKVWPYSVHLDAVADEVIRYAATICRTERDILPIVFGAFFHDSIEDARLTYNDVKAKALTIMDEGQALMAAEIVYALTNEKGRTRAERANEKYYEGIRNTPYAPLCKMADRLANVKYSVEHSTRKNVDMRDVYTRENVHFMEAIVIDDPVDPRMAVPPAMIDELVKKLN